LVFSEYLIYLVWWNLLFNSARNSFAGFTGFAGFAGFAADGIARTFQVFSHRSWKRVQVALNHLELVSLNGTHLKPRIAL
jgi:hypothetical protein